MKIFHFVFIALCFFLFSCEKVNYESVTIYGKITPSVGKRLKYLKEGDKVLSEFKYDALGRLKEVESFHEGGSSIERFEYNGNNQITRRLYFGNLVQTYKYKNEKLTEFTETNASVPEHKNTFVYKYGNGKISRADEYFSNGKKGGFIKFQYDAKGNTTSRVHFYESAKISEYIFTYDDKINPFQNLVRSPIDMIQKNNPIRSYISAIYMSSLPTEITHEYTYDSDNYPVTRISYPTNKSDIVYENITYVYE